MDVEPDGDLDRGQGRVAPNQSGNPSRRPSLGGRLLLVALGVPAMLAIGKETGDAVRAGAWGWATLFVVFGVGWVLIAAAFVLGKLGVGGRADQVREGGAHPQDRDR